jgi:hypothetical protein
MGSELGEDLGGDLEAMTDEMAHGDDDAADADGGDEL